MTNEEYSQWYTDHEKSSYRRSRILKGTRDDIHIIAIPTGRKLDRYIEGFVVRSGNENVFPVGYVSPAWIAESFEFDDSFKITLSPKSHSISMPGWMWLISVPIGLVILGAIMYVLVFVGFARAFRPW
jgi:hypothetical protein